MLLLCTIYLGASEESTAAAELIVPLDEMRVLVAGRIVVHRGERSVMVPAVVNQRCGLVEYLLVHTSGKRHEALFTTSVAPQHVHVACLLVGAPETGAAAIRLASVKVQWQGHGPVVHSTPETLLLPATHDGEPIGGSLTPPAQWSYHGSCFTGDGFAAQIDGSCIALQADASALMQAPGLLASEFVPDAARLPPIGSPVTIVLTFPSPSVEPAAEEHS